MNRSHRSHFDPAELTAEERFSEIVTILAAGLIRLHSCGECYKNAATENLTESRADNADRESVKPGTGYPGENLVLGCGRIGAEIDYRTGTAADHHGAGLAEAEADVEGRS